LPRPAAWAAEVKTIALATAAVSFFSADDFNGRRWVGCIFGAE
jgi:hypothetical protein